MINMLLALTEGETSGNYNAFINSNYWAGLGVLQDLWIDNHDFKESEITFYDNGQELLIYSNLGTFACNYTTYCNMKFITCVYGKNGLVKEYDFFDYERPEMLCLLDLYNAKQEHGEKWFTCLEEIYNKYGVDVTNCVRENAGYNM